MKSNGVFTRAIPARSFTSMMPPRTMPNTIGTAGIDRRFSTKPNTPKQAAIRQSVKELRNE